MSGGKLAELKMKTVNCIARMKEIDIPMGIPMVTIVAEGSSAHSDPQVLVSGSELVTPANTTTIAADASPTSRDPKRTLVDLNEPGRPSKKRKESADKWRRSSSFRVEKFINDWVEEFDPDPIMSSINVFKHFGDLCKAEREDAKAQIPEAIKERDTTTTERDEAIRKLEPTSKSLAQVRNELSELKEEKKKLEEAHGSDAERLNELEDQALEDESEAQKPEEAADRVPNLEVEMKRVKAELEAERGEKRQIKAELEKVHGELTKTLQDTCSLVDEVFKNAFKQVVVVFPTFQRVQDVFHSDHEVAEGKIK